MYDRMFLRAWRLYLTGSIAAFRTGELQLFQALFTRHDNNAIRYSRAHLYE
jgi:cyclopropane-fatty-acyl-phospholipid synthase